VLDCTGVLAVVCELVAAGMPQHVTVNEEGEARGLASPRDHALVAGNAEGSQYLLLALSGHELVHCTCPLMTQSRHWIGLQNQRRAPVINIFYRPSVFKTEAVNGIYR
jgi:hypothetical protein